MSPLLHRAHVAGDVCPVCQAPWETWPMAHRGDEACSQRCREDLADASWLRRAIVDGLHEDLADSPSTGPPS